MKSDIEIAQAAILKPISDIAETLSFSQDDLYHYGEHIAKIKQYTVNQLNHNNKPNGQLILVTAINPTPAGEGKTTTTIGLTDALNHLNHHAVACLREPSLGPVFGLKGGATGGGFAQVVPMENINLHFTGDFHAITSANNLLAALIDNHIYQGNALDIQTVTWRRCMDMNDRALRRMTLDNDVHTGFDITVASEVMAIFCLAEDLGDLTERLGNIQIGCNGQQQAIYAKDLNAEGAMTALLKDAFQPNLVQTIAGSPALVHGGPFANIAHGCNSVVATKTALKCADYVVTEAGFGADLGAEKFIDIKCRLSGLQPALVVIVATIRALKYHGGVEVAALNVENISALAQGLEHLKQHLDNLQGEFGLPVMVALNHFNSDTEQELACIQQASTDWGVQLHVCRHWAQGATGASNLAKAVVEKLSAKQPNAPLHFLYPLDASIPEKLRAIAQKLYGASDIELSPQALSQLETIAAYAQNMPVCVAKTQYSFSSDPNLRNTPKGHILKVASLRLSHGAGFVVAICGNIMTMPGLPKIPASERINVNADGNIRGLS